MTNIEGRKRLAAVPVWEVFNAIEDIDPDERFKKRTLQIPGTKYSYKLYRPTIFLAIGTTCVDCGVEGTYFALEKWGDNSLHFDLYGRDAEGSPVMITIDHILPRSKGGPNQVSNYQPMCQPCNEEKADFRLSPAQIHLLVKAANRNGRVARREFGRTTAKRHIVRVAGLVDKGLAVVVENTQIEDVEEPVPAVINLTSLGKALLPWARKAVERFRAQLERKDAQLERKRKRRKRRERKKKPAKKD